MDIGYVRTSKDNQHPDNQINLLIDRGISPQHIFIDAGVSGTVPAERREGYTRMMRFIKSNPVERIYVFEIARLGRTFIDTLNKVVELEERGINVISLSPAESWTTTADPNFRKLILVIISWVAQRERENLVERVKAGQARAIKEGQHIGRPRKKINWKEVETYLSRGLTLSAISRVINIPYTTLLRTYKEERRQEE